MQKIYTIDNRFADDCSKNEKRKRILIGKLGIRIAKLFKVGVDGNGLTSDGCVESMLGAWLNCRRRR